MKPPIKLSLMPILLLSASLCYGAGVREFGAIPDDNKDDTEAIRAALNAGNIEFEAGEYHVSGTINVGNDRKMTGVAGQFNVIDVPDDGKGGGRTRYEFPGWTKIVARPDQGKYAFFMNDRSESKGIHVYSHEGCYLGKNNAVGVKITQFICRAGRGGSARPEVINFPNGSNGVVIEYGHFYDSFGPDRCVNMYTGTNYSYRFCTFYGVNDGGHLTGCTNGKVGYFHAQRVRRCILEFQDHAQFVEGNNLIEGFVAYDWQNPFRDTGLFGMPQFQKNVAWRKIWLRSDQTGDFSSDGRFGIPVEVGTAMENQTQGKSTGILENFAYGAGYRHDLSQKLLTQWGFGVLCATKDFPYKNGRTYGPKPKNSNWFGGEPGNWAGSGSMIDEGNVIVGLPVEEMGLPPDRKLLAAGPDMVGAAPTWKGPVPDDGSEPPLPPQAVQVVNLNATPIYSQVNLRWSYEGGTPTATVMIKRFWKNGQLDPDFGPEDHPGHVILAAGSNKFTDTEFTSIQLIQTWEFKYGVYFGSDVDMTGLVQVSQVPPDPEPPDPQPEPPTTQPAFEGFKFNIDGTVQPDGKMNVNPNPATQPL